MTKKVKLEWNVIAFDFNCKDLKFVNVLEGCNERIYEEFKKGNLKSLQELRNLLERILKSVYWCRCEYEIFVLGHFQKVAKKIDAYYQVEMNMDRLVEYVNNTMQLNLK